MASKAPGAPETIWSTLETPPPPVVEKVAPQAAVATIQAAETATLVVNPLAACCPPKAYSRQPQHNLLLSPWIWAHPHWSRCGGSHSSLSALGKWRQEEAFGVLFKLIIAGLLIQQWREGSLPQQPKRAL